MAKADFEEEITKPGFSDLATDWRRMMSIFDSLSAEERNDAILVMRDWAKCLNASRRVIGRTASQLARLDSGAELDTVVIDVPE